jgi:hypothetical protein
MTRSFYPIENNKNLYLKTKNADIETEMRKNERGHEALNHELSAFFEALAKIASSNDKYKLFRLGFEVEDLLREVVTKRLEVIPNANGLSRRAQPISDCIIFLKSAKNFMNAYLDKEQPSYQEKLNLTRARFIQATDCLQKNIAPTFCERLRGIVSMFLGALITLCSFGYASSATAIRGYHLFFGEKNKLINFKDNLLENTSTKKNLP